MSKLSGNYATNCEFQLQLVHSQLQLQLPDKLINYLAITIRFYNYPSLTDNDYYQYSFWRNKVHM